MVAVMSPSATPSASMNVGAPWCLRLTTLTTREHSPDRLALAQDSLRHSQELPSRDPSPKLPPYFFYCCQPLASWASMSLLAHGIVNRCLRETCPETDVGITVVSEVYGPLKAQAQFFFDNNGIARARPRFRRASSELPYPGLQFSCTVTRAGPHAVWGSHHVRALSLYKKRR